MLMEMSDNVFADSSTSMGFVEPALTETNMTAPNNTLLQWTNTCALGDSASCGMSYKVNDAGNLEFRVQFSLIGNNRARTDVADATLELEPGLVVNTAPFGVGVSFICEYPMTVNLESSAFNVTEVTVSGTKSGKGDLSAGFAMNLNDGNDAALVLGAELKVQVDWSVTTLAGIEFYFNECNVRHEPASNTTHPAQVPVVKGGCYSGALKCSRATDGTSTSQGFAFQTFTIEGETGSEQIVSCSMKLCKSDDCAGKTPQDADCPADSGYEYTANGYSKA